MTRIRPQILLLTFFTAFLLNSPIASPETLTLGIGEAIFPYAYKQDNQLTGIDVDIGRKIFERLGIELKIEAFPWKRLTQNLERGVVDGALAMLKLDFEAERLRDALDMASECMYLTKIAIYARKDRKLSISSPADLEGKSVGTIGGYLYDPAFDKVKGLQQVHARDDENLVQRLEKGRVDVVIAEDKPFWFYSKQRDIQDKFEEVYVVKRHPVCMGFSRKVLGSRSTILADRVSHIVRQLKTEGVIQRILNKYK